MKRKWLWLWGLTAIESLIAIVLVFRLPSERKSAVLFGLSASRLIMVGWMLIAALLCYFLIRKTFYMQEEEFVRSDPARQQIVGWIGILSGFFIGMLYLFFSPPMGNSAFSRAVFERIKPFLIWGAAFAIQVVLLLIWAKIEKSKGSVLHGWLRTALLQLLGFTVFIAFIQFSLSSGLGLTTISGTFYRQGVSLLEGQLLIPLLLIFALMLVYNLSFYMSEGMGTVSNTRQKLLFALVAILIWVITAMVWIGIPFEGRSYFLPAYRAPNYNFYPASDAENYDMLAQSLLIGNGFFNGLIVARPIYVLFLSILHLFAGNDYIQLTNLQIIVLAAFPVLVFALGCQLKKPFAGLLVAIWVVLREVYSIRLTPIVQISNSRLLMSDLPTALLVTLLLNSIVALLKSAGARSKWALVSGGICGIAILLRTQMLIFVPVIIVILLIGKIEQREKTSHMLRSIALFTMAVFIVIIPWFMLNASQSKIQSGMDQSEGAYLLSLYRNASGMQPLNETLTVDSNDGIFRIIKDHPVEISTAIGAHFFNNALSSLLVLPVRTSPMDDISQWFNDPTVFWYRESSREAIESNTLLVLVYGFLTVFGVLDAYRRNRFSGLLPLVFFFSYALGNALALTSGFRFILPADWVLLFYFGYGLVSIFQFLLNLIGENPRIYTGNEIDPVEVQIQKPKYRVAIPVLLMIGLLLPSANAIIPYRFDEPAPTYEVWSQNNPEGASIITNAAQSAAADAAGMEVITGRIIYPRYYKPTEGDSGGNSSVKREADFGRMVWMLINRQVQTVSLRTNDPALIQNPFPDPLDVLIVGRQREDHFEAYVIEPLDQSIPAIYASE